MPEQKEQGKGKKILGMPRTTGIIVLGLAAVVAGYLIISRMGGSSSSGQGGGGSGGGGGGGGWQGSGGRTVVEIFKGWQGHQPRGHGRGRGEGEDEGGVKHG